LMLLTDNTPLSSPFLWIVMLRCDDLRIVDNIRDGGRLRRDYPWNSGTPSGSMRYQ
jgi:hypothetical protein